MRTGFFGTLRFHDRYMHFLKNKKYIPEMCLGSPMTTYITTFFS